MSDDRDPIQRAFELWKLIVTMESVATLAGITRSDEGRVVRAFVQAYAEQHPEFSAFEAGRAGRTDDTVLH